MTSPDWQRVDELLDAVMELPPQERTGFLDRECNGDTTLRREVESLLASHDQASGFFDSPPAAIADDLIRDRQAEALVGHAIGPYRIVREIGRGGMGVVYLAERTDDQYRRQVAIKLLWPGLHNTEIVRRFRRERQILANLDHPQVAKLFDGGTTEEGWPYFVMEYVAGQPITEYFNTRGLGVAERLRLFQQVCAAVQYAHQTLVIHRDLKPGNILVTENGTAKLLDFGIAKLLDPARHDITAQPTTNALMMTPDYASPEQMRGEPITTASDVYSLGILLYELLTGGHPYQIKDRSLPELVRVVCEQEPEAPSQRVGQSGKLPHGLGETKPERLRAQLRGDLDQITQTAIQKDANIRYRSVEQLSEDLRRHLEGLPIMARKASLAYRSEKFVRRNRLGVLAGALVFLTLLGGIVATAWQARVANEQARANRRLAYTGQMALATQAWEMANIERMRTLVESYLPRDGEEDLRGFEWYYLWRLYHHTGELFSRRHPKEVWAVAFAPDGTQFATACDDGKVRLWDAATGAQRAELSGHQQYVWAVVFSPDGRMLATGSGDKTAKLWDVASGRELATLTGHTNRVSAVAFAPDSKRLATGSRDGTVRLWEVATGQERMTIRTGATWVNALAFAPDGKKLVIGRGGAMAFAPDGKKLVVGRNGVIAVQLYDAITGHEIANGTSGSQPWAVAFAPDGKTFATGDGSSRVKLWDAATGRELATLGGHTGEVRSVAFSPDGQTLASASDDRTVKLWDIAVRREVAALKGHLSAVFAVAFAPDGKRMVTGSADRAANLWELATAAEHNVFHASVDKGLTVALSLDGKKLLTRLSPVKAPLVWDAITLQELVAFKKHDFWYAGVAFSPNGQQVAASNHDKTARLFDAATGQELVTFNGHADRVTAVVFSPDGQRLATGSYDKTVRMWDAATGRELMRLGGHENRCDALAFSPDGKRLATGSYDTTAKLWDAATGQELATFKGHANPILTIAFSPDGTTLATGSADSLVKLWQVGRGGREYITIQGHAGHVMTLAYSPDGKRLATGGSEGLVRLWDVANGQELIALRGHAGSVNSVAFSADGTLLVSSGGDGFVRLWRAATKQEVVTATRR